MIIMRKLLFNIITTCLLTPLLAHGQASYEWMYWFDSGSEVTASGTCGADLHLDLDVSRLTPGVHKMHFMVRDLATDRLCDPTARFFVIPEDYYDQDDIMYYWYDNDTTMIWHFPVQDGPILLDVEGMSPGIHTLHLQAKHIETGRFTTPERRFFIIPEPESEGDELFYWYDNDKEMAMRCPASDGAIMLDVSALAEGFHTIHFQARSGETGRMSDLVTRFFVVPERETDEDATFHYWFDDKNTDMASMPVGSGALMLGVDALSDGVHMLHSFIRRDGRTSNLMRQAFVKQPLGGNAIVRYTYWLNDAYSTRYTAKVEEPANPYELIDILPFASVPLRSCSFHFEVSNGIPAIFAKNDLHVTFTDKLGHESEECVAQFVDVNVSEQVTGINDLQPTQTFARPEENKVKWFSFVAAPNDSVSLKSSQTTTIQIFDAMGNVLYAADGNASTKFDGCCIAEEGTYYVAIHDVTGSKSEMTLESVINHRTDIDTGILSAGGSIDKKIVYYDLSGRKLQGTRNLGITIKRLGDGRVIKVIGR